MATVDEIPAEDDPIHEIIIGDSKTGKSTYVAQAAIDGFTVIYIDSDNGLSALRHALRVHPEARKRVHYVATRRPVNFMTGFLRSTAKRPFCWNHKLDREWGKMATDTQDDDVIDVYDHTAIPKQWVVVQDSWTAMASDALGIGDSTQLAELLKGTDQGIYGTASAQLTFICNMLQKVPYHLIVQAHGTRFEVYDKPTGVTGAAMKQKDMVLREVKDVPQSCSRPHGETMVSRFNHIGWLYITNTGLTEIDFTRRPNRVGGGPPNKKALITDLPFSKLVPSIPPAIECDTWHWTRTHKELKG